MTPCSERNKLGKCPNRDSQQLYFCVVNKQMSFHCARARSPRKLCGFLSFEFYSLFSMLCFCVHLRFKIDFSSVVFVFPLSPQNSSLGFLILKLSSFEPDKPSKSERGQREAVKLKSPKALEKIKCV